MFSIVRKHLTTIVVAMVTAMVTAGAPAMAHGVQHALFAHNADKVDGKHAVGAGAGPAQRASKLVATKSNGKFPNSIIAKAPNANKVDGIDGKDLVPGGVLPSGATIRGHYATMGRGNGSGYQIASHGLSFGYRLPSAPTPEVILQGEASNAHCPGSVANPQAAPGFLCLYENDAQAKRDNGYPRVAVGSVGNQATDFGAYVYTQSSSTTTGFFWSRGSWAVTAG